MGGCGGGKMGGMPPVIGGGPEPSEPANTEREKERRTRRLWRFKRFLARWWFMASIGILALLFIAFVWALLPQREVYMAPDVEKEEILPKQESKATGPRPGQPGHPVGMFGFPSKRSFFFGLP